MRTLFATILCLNTLTAQPKQQRRAPDSKTLQVEGSARTYLLTQPVQRSQAIPVVIVLHGAGGSGEKVARFTRLHTSPFIRTALVVYPDNLGQNNDIAFLKTLIEELLKTDKALDRTRIFAVGINNGGSFAMRLGCELNDKIAAVASVGGPFPKSLQQTCKPADPVPVLYFQSGVAGEETFEFWSKTNQCSGVPLIEDRSGETPAKIHIAKKCKEGSEVRWIRASTVSDGWQAETAKEIATFLSRFHRAPRF